MKDQPDVTRRRLVQGLTGAALLPLFSANLIGCADSSDRQRTPTVPADFRHGVASGDPLGDSVILWTRLTPERPGVVGVGWEVALDESFTEVVVSGSGTTTAEVDYTVKVDVQGLSADTHYYYRFSSGDKVSPVGRARTAPTGAVVAASFAVVSCSNYPAGYFHAYREIANRDYAAVLHLGDYIYEYPADGYASDDAQALGRVSEPANELLTLADYRRRYAQYRSDADLQACHAAHPFIVVWDDHEVANNTWKGGAENHQPETEGDFFQRRTEAIQAWYEWLPVRPPASEREITYRRFDYGDLLDLIMLDTRVIGRDLQLEFADFVNGELIDVDTLRAAVADPGRSLLGEAQLNWLRQSLTDSTARWQVLGQQVLMTRLVMPEPLVRPLSGIGDGGLGEATSALLAALAAKATPPENRSPEQQALLDSAIPLNLDAWDGYDFEREDILAHAHQLQSRLVVLAGDSHNSWASQLTLADGTPVGVEFAGASVTSPGAEGQLGVDNAVLFAPLATQLVDDLHYANLADRGFMEIVFNTDEVRARWHYVSDIKSRDYTLLQDIAAERVVSGADMLLS
ncbi:alkaline phosphatase [Pseudohalioglobus sediminis]|uniref:Alkaline phosphatase n=1 Tax=Pseudohalioglobus sediminis TaxID=2606449 RepID=A0A5B0X037_9GAMM|nr:alkaline phosphatase D family protein [Pseudohalioglobus sediminis]KAA1192015.1 alkaline phosphatase [Pseudohalioglobus sediminis]